VKTADMWAEMGVWKSWVMTPWRSGSTPPSPLISPYISKVH